ncbi:MAG TPA: hypothetical protein DHN33_02395, partial [Eubacteriaceae bacterium]|nr:hypothetical protein [Eubacteriaceae bacterium]
MKWKWAGLLLIVFTALLIGCEAESENDPAAVNYEETIYRSGWNEEQKKEEEKLIELQSKEELQEFVDFFPPYEEGLEESIFYKEETYQSHRVFAYALVGISGSNQLEGKEAGPG